jgi:hypothetical protein
MVASPQNFFTKYETRGFEMAVVLAEELIFIVDQQPMPSFTLAKNIEHDLADSGFAAALRLTHQHYDHFGVALWVLN